MASAKMFNLENNLTVDAVGKGIEDFLRDKKKMKTQAVKNGDNYVIKAESEETWLRFVGLGLMQQVQLVKSGGLVSVTALESRWIEKFLAWFACLILETIFVFVFWPLLFVPFTFMVCITVGIIRQYLLPNQIMDFTEMFIMGGGRKVSVNLGFSSQAAEKEQAKTVCPKCKASIASDMKFCEVCGTKLKDECPYCHASIAVGKKFCPSCGKSLDAGASNNAEVNAAPAQRKCPKCQSVVGEGQKFCVKCGAPLE